MKQTWRWFGPHDTVSIDDISQAGVEGIVTALHHVPNGIAWSVEEIQKRQGEIAHYNSGQPSALAWDVVESLPVSEPVKQQCGDWKQHLHNYRQSLENLARCGIKIVCYNFMPLLDWTRTDLTFTLGNGARCMRFDINDFAAFDIHILKRDNALDDFPEGVVEEAQRRFQLMSEERKQGLARNIVCGLPGAEEGYSLENLKEHLSLYSRIDETTLRKHQLDFLNEVVPTAEKLGIKLCCHPDDPPFSLLGLPRIMSCEEDYATLVKTLDTNANGITLCSGSLGVNANVDLPGMMNRLGHRVHFIHLRNVARETDGQQISFHEAAHLEGATDMVALIKAILSEEARRKNAGEDDQQIPFRPDHGQEILHDLTISGQPGYPAIGRLKGLAELRGIATALAHIDS
ncbi:MAG: mannonate dehydratase [Granulosicoccus sp.]